MAASVNDASALIDATEARSLFGKNFDEKIWRELTKGSGSASRGEVLKYLTLSTDFVEVRSPSEASPHHFESTDEGTSPRLFSPTSTGDDDDEGPLFESPREEENVSTEKKKKRSASTKNADRFFKHLKLFFQHQREIDALWMTLPSEKLLEIESLDLVQIAQHTFDSIGQQPAIPEGGASKILVPAQTVGALYAAANRARPAYEMFLRRTCKAADIDISKMRVAPLKAISRTLEKAQYEYADRPGAPISWVSDVVRGSVVCDDQDQIVRFLHVLNSKKNNGVTIVKLSNRFRFPTPAGFRDVNVKIRIEPSVVAPALGSEIADAVAHICEIQIHLKQLADFSKEKASHETYKFFRHFFRGNWKEVAEQSRALQSLLDTNANDDQHADDDCGDALHFEAAVKRLLGEENEEEELHINEKKTKRVVQTKKEPSLEKKKKKKTTSATVNALAQLADETLGLHAVAEALYEKLARLLVEETGSKRHVSVGVANMKRGFALLNLCAYDAAVESFKLALTALSSHPEKYVQACAGQGRCLVAKGDLSAAGSLYKQALSVLKQTKMDRRYGGVLLSARMELQIKSGHYGEALKDIAAAEASMKELTTAESPEIGMCWVQRSTALLAQAEDAGFADDKDLKAQLVEAALKEANRAHSLLHRLCGNSSTYLGDALLQKAKTLLVTGAKVDCEEAATVASAAVERITNPLTLAVAHRVKAEALDKVGRLGDARASRRAARDILESHVQKGGEDLVRVLLAESAAYAKTSDVKRAVDLGEEALKKAKDCYGEHHLVLVEALRHVAKLHEDVQNFHLANEHLQRAVQVVYALLGRNCPVRGSFDEVYGIHSFMLKGPPALLRIAGDSHYAVACLAEITRDFKKAIHHYEAASHFLKAARGQDCAAGQRIDSEIKRLQNRISERALHKDVSSRHLTYSPHSRRSFDSPPKTPNSAKKPSASSRSRPAEGRRRRSK